MNKKNGRAVNALPLFMWLFPFSFLALAYSVSHLHLTCDQNPKDRQNKSKLNIADLAISRATNLLLLYFKSAEYVFNL